MKTNILLPTDFSKNAMNAIQYAFNLYEKEACTFYILHSSYFKYAPSRAVITSHFIATLKKQGKDQMEELQQQLQTQYSNSNHEFKFILTNEDLKDAIRDAVEEYQINMVVMGTKGANEAPDIFAGSNTVDTLHHVKNCPILIIPNEYVYVQPKLIAFPTDYNRFYNDKELRPLLNMADLHNSKIKIFHINVEKKLTAVQRNNMKLLDNYLLFHAHNFYWLPKNTEKTKAIEAFIKELNIDMLVMVNYNHSLIENLLNEPVIKKLAFHPKIPILVVPE